MRQLTTNDVFKMSRILKKLDIKLNSDIDTSSENFDAIIGTEILLKIAENAYLAQDEINEFIGGLAGMTGEEFGNLGIKETMAIIKQFKELDGVADFFQYVGQ